MLTVDSLNEQVHYSEAYWEQFTSLVLAGDSESSNSKGLDPKLLEKIKAIFFDLSNIDLVHAIANEIRINCSSKKQKGEKYWEELNLLYWIAAMISFFFDAYLESFVEAEDTTIAPVNMLESLTFSYHDLGYKALPLFNQEDVELMIKTWGKPRNHKTLRAIHRNVWDDYINDKIKVERQEMNQPISLQDEMVSELQERLARFSNRSITEGNKGWLPFAVILVLGLFVLFLVYI